jgi:pimeloyl-ACP methyl ester carboxylesterase
MHVECRKLEGDGDTLVVTFNEMWNHYSSQNFWGERPLKKLGLPAYGIVTDGPNWFPAADALNALREPITASRKYKHIILYGYSMGAYGAIKYSSLFDNPIVLAFSPQFSIDPADCGGFDDRYEPYFNLDYHRRMKIVPEDVGGSVYIFYDPFNAADQFHAKSIPGDCHLIKVRYISHETVRAIGNTANLKSIFDLALQGDAMRLSSIMNKLKKNSIAYRRAILIKLVEQGRFRWGHDYLKKNANHITSDAWSLVVAGNIYTKAGDNLSAARVFKMAYEISGDEVHRALYQSAASTAA